jgi:hypothetical protein
MQFNITKVSTPLALYVPMARLETQEEKERFGDFCRELAQAAGGFTYRGVSGGWVMDSGELVVEGVRVVEVCIPFIKDADSVRAATQRVEDAFLAYAGYLIELGEEAVFTTSQNGGVIITQATAQEAKLQVVGDTQVTLGQQEVQTAANEGPLESADPTHDLVNGHADS